MTVINPGISVADSIFSEHQFPAVDIKPYTTRAPLYIIDLAKFII